MHRGGLSARLVVAWAGVAASAAGAAAGITAVYRGMRNLMVESGGVCASGGPYEIASECSDGQIALLMGGIGATFVFVIAHMAFTAWARGPDIGPFFIAGAGFGALGWNFIELGLDSPQGDGLVGGWLVSGVVFWLMAAGFMAPALWRALDWVRRGGEPEPPLFKPALVNAARPAQPPAAAHPPAPPTVPTRLVPPRPPGGSP